MTKFCTKCKISQSTIEFYLRPNTKVLDSWCRSCHRISAKERLKNPTVHKQKLASTRNWVKKNKKYVDDRRLKVVYGIGTKEKQDLLEIQNNQCAICYKDQSTSNTSFHIDHNHITGIIRGLLCSPCNTGLGQFKDNIETLSNAIKYIKNNGIDKFPFERSPIPIKSRD